MNDAGLEQIRAARRELDEVIAEIRTVPGYETFLAPPTFEDVVNAAREQPLVYLAAADRGGLALIVRGDDVAHLPFDKLTVEALHDQVNSYRNRYAPFRADQEAGLGGWRQALDSTSAWLWEVAVGAVLEELGPVPGVNLVGGGLLSLLPLHAASAADATAPTGRRYALDVMPVSYVPNARSLIAARDVAASCTPDRLLAVVDPPRFPSVGSLRLAGVEAKAAAAGFAGSAELLPGPSPTGPAATVGNVAAALRRADVVHLACHGLADFAVPLESGLLLADQDVLRLRDLLALSLRVRLAVLSACETAIPGTDLPDEVVALPTGLLQAGVAGIVASLWAVPDTATAMLMTEFYRQWRWDGLAPATALRGSQQWLRDTTNAEKIDGYEVALDAAAGWLPPDVGEAFLDELAYREPGDRDEQGLYAWAGFAHVGV
jgi:CHAT domain-containing protein